MVELAVLSWTSTIHLSSEDLEEINQVTGAIVIPLGGIDTSFDLPFNDKLIVKLIEPKCSGSRIGSLMLETTFHQV